MHAATKDLKQGRHYFRAALELRVAFSDPGRSSCFKHARQVFTEMQKPSTMGAALTKTAHIETEP